MNFSALPFKNLFRRPGRSAFAAIGISLAVGSFVSMSVVLGGIAENWETSLSDRGIHAIVMRENQVDWLAGSLPETLADDLAEVAGVRSANPELASILTTRDGTALLVAGWPEGAVLWDGIDLAAGNLPISGQALAGDGVAAAFGLNPGDTLSLDGLTVAISGVFHSDDLLMSGRIILPLADLQEQMFRQGTATVVHLSFDDPADTAMVGILQDRIATTHPGLSVRSSEGLADNNRAINLLNVLRNVVVWTVALAGIAGTANIMLMAVNERRSEIGLFLALGWSPGRVVALFLMESVFLAAVSGAIGIGVGAVIIEIVRTNSTLAAFLSDTMNAGTVIEGLALAVGIGALGGILPALRVMRVPADQALRAI